MRCGVWGPGEGGVLDSRAEQREGGGGLDMESHATKLTHVKKKETIASLHMSWHPFEIKVLPQPCPCRFFVLPPRMETGADPRKRLN